MIAADDNFNKLLFVVKERGMRAGFQRFCLTRARLHKKDRNLHRSKTKKISLQAGPMSLKPMANKSPHHPILLRTRTSCDLFYGTTSDAWRGLLLKGGRTVLDQSISLRIKPECKYEKKKPPTASSLGHNQMYSFASRRPR